MLFYHAHTHSLTHSLSLIQFNIKWKFRLLVQFENRRYCYTQRLLFRLFKVCTLMLYTFSNSVCTIIIVIILFCFAYPCIVQAIHTVVVSVCVLERASELKPAHAIWREWCEWTKTHSSYQCSLMPVDWLAGWLAYPRCMHIGTYATLKCVVCEERVYVERSFHSQSYHCHGNNAALRRNWATLGIVKGKAHFCFRYSASIVCNVVLKVSREFYHGVFFSFQNFA